MHLGKGKKSKRRVVMEGLLPPAGGDTGLLRHFPEVTPAGEMLPLSARACTDSQRWGNSPSLPELCKTEPLPPTPVGSGWSEELSTDNLNSSPVMAAICEANHT